MIPERVQNVLLKYNLEALVFEPGSTPTSELAAQKIGVEVGQIAKSILLKGKDGLFRLAVMPGDKKISSGKMKKVTGIKHRMATAEETFEQTGFRVGGVCPFDLEQFEIFIDQGLQAYGQVYPAAGTDASGVPVSFEQLVDITRGQVCDLSQE